MAFPRKRAEGTRGNGDRRDILGFMKKWGRRVSWDPEDSWDPLAPGVPLGALELFGAPEARQPEFMHVGGFA